GRAAAAGTAAGAPAASEPTRASRTTARSLIRSRLPGQPLLDAQDRREEVAELVGAPEDLLGVERQHARVSRVQAAAHLVPAHRRRDGRALARAHRVDVDRRLLLVALGP